MAIKKNEVNLGVTTIINYLNEGYTWLKKDDLGYGSIQELYKANEKQIETIRRHPAFKDADTCITIFNIIDDTKKVESHSDQMIDIMNNERSNSTNTKESTTTTSRNMEERTVALECTISEVDAFANL